MYYTDLLPQILLSLYNVLLYSSFVGVTACLISESKVFAPIRKWLKWDLLYCPICLAFWLALPFFAVGFFHYFLAVGFSNVWILLILKVYRELDLATEDDPETGE